MVGIYVSGKCPNCGKQHSKSFGITEVYSKNGVGEYVQTECECGSTLYGNTHNCKGWELEDGTFKGGGVCCF